MVFGFGFGLFKRPPQNRYSQNRYYKMTPKQTANSLLTVEKIVQGIKKGKYNHLLNDTNVNKKFENVWGPNAAEEMRKRRNTLQKRRNMLQKLKQRRVLLNGNNFGRVTW
jgi:hypothetical protein